MADMVSSSLRPSSNQIGDRARCYINISGESDAQVPGPTQRMATAAGTNAADEDRLSLRITAARCVSTVLRLRLRMLAICLLEWPSAISCTISRSRGVRMDWVRLGLKTKDFSRVSDTLDVKNDLWAASVSIA